MLTPVVGTFEHPTMRPKHDTNKGGKAHGRTAVGEVATEYMPGHGRGHQWSFAEIARMAGCSVSTVKQTK